MKKSTAVVLMLMFILGIASTAFAATNAFVDVPAEHWAYKAIAQLAKDGILQGFKEGKYQGNKSITRYEMAMITANAMARADKGHADDRVLINKLAAEFSEELSVMGVHVENIGKQLDKTHIFGLVFVKYEHGDMGYGTSDVNYKLNDGVKLQLNANYKVNEDWSVFTVQEYLRDFRNVSAGDPIGTSDQSKQIGIGGRIGASSISVGEFHEFTSYGVIFDANIQGVQLGLGNSAIPGEPPGPPSGPPKPQLTLTWGYLWHPCNMRLSDPLYNAGEPQISAAELFYPATPDTNVNLGYFNVSRYGETSRHYATIGFDKRLTKDIVLTLFHGKSSYETDSKSYLVGLNYKFPDFMNPGSYGIYLNYERIEANAAIYPTFVVQDPDHGTNGLEFGYSFVPMRKTLVELIYAKMKATTANDSWKDNYFRCQFRFFF